MSANSRIYVIEDEGVDAEAPESTEVVHYELPDNSNIGNLRIVNATSDKEECYSLTFEDRRNTDLISLLEKPSQFDLIEDAEVSYRSHEERMMGTAGTRKEYVFLSEDDREEAKESAELRIFLEDINLSRHKPPEKKISENDFESTEITVTAFNDRIESDKKDFYTEFLEEDDIDYVERALNHYRKIIRPELEINIEK